MYEKSEDIKRILETAIVQEIKSKEFYMKMFEQISDNSVRTLFKHMANAEHEHEDILKCWYEESYGEPFDLSKIQGQKQKINISNPEFDLTLMEAIKLIANAESKAFQFYKNAAKEARNPEEKKLFERLADLEELHVDLSRTELQMISDEMLHFSENDVPWDL